MSDRIFFEHSGSVDRAAEELAQVVADIAIRHDVGFRIRGEQAPGPNQTVASVQFFHDASLSDADYAMRRTFHWLCSLHRLAPDMVGRELLFDGRRFKLMGARMETPAGLHDSYYVAISSSGDYAEIRLTLDQLIRSYKAAQEEVREKLGAESATFSIGLLEREKFGGTVPM